MKNDTYLNILVSYAYLYGQKGLLRLVADAVQDKKINLMIDSGAFTKFNAKSAMKHINIEDYTAWLKDYSWMCEKYVMLDVIGKAEESKKNYEYMLSKGLNLMYVVTMYDRDYDYIRQTIRNNPNICVAGGATTKGDWMTKRFQDIYLQSDKKAKIHGLGYVTFPKMYQLNLASVDSSTWCTAPARFGCFVFFSIRQGRIYEVQWRNVIKRCVKINDEVLREFEKRDITPAMFSDKTYHTCEMNIEKFMSIIENLKLQKYSYRRHLSYFMAVGSKDDLNKILLINDNQDITYKQFKSL